MKQADLDEGRRADGLTTAERDELSNEVHDIWTMPRHCYGSPRVRDELRLGRIASRGLLGSMGSISDCFDNSVADVGDPANRPEPIELDRSVALVDAAFGNTRSQSRARPGQHFGR
jgi:hypothetical protein